ncbi:hypothetical protein CRI94_06860 [Longibacter salinarum]|uniref:Peptidase S8 n=1 Tax=Longibacter salinarum TaxID=1850348 RepID=A0A2A8CYV9_9BACT|nr:S8/S53 family peptidase [Longibacter salinarum]PEN13783.1 hypothetical protein CRI94_06860 [Longibacter salinarum]
MKRFATVFLLVVLGVFVGLRPAAGQDLTAEQVAKLDGRLRSVVAHAVPSAGLPQDQAPAVAPITDARKNAPARYRVVLRTSAGEALRAAGMPIQTALSRVSTARLTPRQMVDLVRRDDVSAIHAAIQNEPHNDEAAGLSGIRALNNGRLNNTNYTGAGVASCVIDSGVDFTHRDFREIADPSKSRILSIWDQTLSAQSGESTPTSYSYGVEYTKADIEDEIDGSPAGYIRQKDTSGHGTHVAGTMAGNGGADPEGRYVGMAPESSMIVVKTDFSSTGIIDAANYCSTVATSNGMPVVANLSLGTDYGPHDGTLDQDIGLSDWATAAPGRAAIASAGNSADNGQHLTGTIAGGASKTIEVDIPGTYEPEPGTNNDVLGIDFWFDGVPNVDFTVTTPNGHTGSMSFGSNNSVDTPEGEIQFFQGISQENGDYEVVFQLADAEQGTQESDTLTAGTLTIEITNNETSSASYHGWRYRDGVGTTLPAGDGAFTIGSPGSALEVIAAGSYVHQWVWCSESDGCLHTVDRGSPNRGDDVSSFSSVGPLRNVSQTKPDVAAPGEMTPSSYSSDYSTSGFYVADGGKHRFSRGTSMSAPVVAGAAVLLLQENPGLTSGQIREALQSGASTDAFTGSVPNDTWGFGKLDAIGAMNYVIDASASYSREVIAYDDWSSSETPISAGSAPVAVRFEASSSGVLSGVLFHTAKSNAVTGPISVEVWSDDGSGFPDQKVSQTVTTPAGSVQNYSWNYVDFAGAGFEPEAGTPYHIVVSAASGDDLQLVSSTQSVDGRSSIRSGGTWDGVSSDLRIRPIVTSTEVSGQLPVELSGFSGHVDEDRVILTWNTLSEATNDGFVVEHAREGGSFSRIGFVDGAGTTRERQSYSYTTRACDAGTHRFRLRQVDVDGTSTLGPETTVVIGLQQPYVLSQVAPNPVRDRATLTLEVKKQQEVRAELFNVLGQRVRVLHDGAINPGSEQTISVNSADLASGIYFVRVKGETFSETRKFVRVR